MSLSSCAGFRGASRGQGKRHRCATEELIEEVERRTPLLPARAPDQHQDRMRLLMSG
jgi:hypothetical protein